LNDEQSSRPQEASSYFDAVRRIAGGEKPRPTVPSGFAFIDANAGGWRPGLHLIAGAPGCGKSAFVMHSAHAAATAGTPVLYLGFDIEPKVVTLRLLCQETGWSLRDASDGKIDEQELDAALADQREIFRRISIMEANVDLSASAVEGMARSLRDTHTTDTCLIVVDYLQVWASGNREFSEFRHEVAKLTTSLRQTSLSVESPILAISSQRRQAQGEPSLTSLEGTSDLEYSADTVTFLVQIEPPASQHGYNAPEDTKNPTRSMSLNLRKNRFGDTSSRIIKFMPSSGAFDEEALQRPAG
jgi:replicative DNA helicase